MFVRAVYTERTDMEKARTDVLYYALKEKGYPDDFCREIAYKQMNTERDHSEKRTGTCTGNDQPDLQRGVVTVRIWTKEKLQ